MNNKKILAIIPARGGSKRLPGKNIMEFCGKPMIAYSIEAAKNSKYIDRVIVTTDDSKIAEVSKKYGAEIPFMRPAELATDTATTVDTIIHAINFMKDNEGYVPDFICLMQATSPMRTYEDMNKACELLLSRNADACVSVVPTKITPYFTNTIDNNGFYHNYFVPGGRKYISQLIATGKIPKTYVLNGSMYFIRTDIFMKEKIFEPENTVAYVMDEYASADIDTIQDFKVAEFIMKDILGEKMNNANNITNMTNIDNTNKNNTNNDMDNVHNNTSRCFIIAEAGVNHNGSLEIAKKLVDAAKEAGADAVKFQTFKAEKLVTRTAKMAEYQEKNTGVVESQYDMLKRLELKEEFHKILFDYCQKKGIQFMSTPFDEDAIDFLDDLGVDALKAGSSDANNIPYLIKMAKKGKPIYLSSGMSDLAEMKESVDAIKKTNPNIELVVLHCTTEYPCPYDQVNLRAMETMRKELGVPIGYSDHTKGIEVPVAAVAMGAVVIEKHFTLDRNMEGPDHVASLEPQELTQMVKEIRNIEMAFGDGKKELAPAAEKYIAIAKKSVVAKLPITKGTIITNDMLEIKRPGTGMLPKEIYNIVGKKATKDIEVEELLHKDMFANMYD